MMIKAVVLRAVAAVMAAVLLVFAGSSAGGEYDVRDPENCRLDFTVMSDVHIEGNNFPRYTVYARALQDVKKNRSGNDAVVFLGDSTMNGQAVESLLFYGAAARVLKDETVIPVQGNHDIGNGSGDYDQLLNRWYDYNAAFFGLELSAPYYYEVIDGCYFIVLATEAQTVHELVMTEAQFTWLQNVLDAAADSGRPCFVFCHYPTDYAETADGEASDRLMEMLAEYNREHDVFVFVGHTHMPMYLFWSFHNSDGFPETYLPRLTELSGSDDREYYKDTGVGVVVEVYENEVTIRARDFFRGEWRYEDDEPCEVTYELKNPYPMG